MHGPLSSSPFTSSLRSQRQLVSSPRVFLAWAVVAVIFAGTVNKQAEAAERVLFIYVVNDVAIAKGVANAPLAEVELALRSAIEKNSTLTTTLPADAPDPKRKPDEFKRFMAKKRLQAFRVNLEVTGYKKVIDNAPSGRARVSVHIELRIFGETLPQRVMAFAGAGSATVQLDAGKRVRAIDEKAANTKSIRAAVSQALDQSVTKLTASDPKTKKARGAKRGSKKGTRGSRKK